MGAVNDIGEWITRLKRMYDISKEARSVELSESIADLRIVLTDWKIKFSDLAEENLELKAKIRQLEKEGPVSADLVFREGLYYRPDSVEGLPNGPFCPACFESSGNVISLTSQEGSPFSVFGKFICPKCTQTFGKNDVHDF